MPLSVRKFAYITIMGKIATSVFFVFFFQIGFSLADNQDRYEISI